MLIWIYLRSTGAVLEFSLKKKRKKKEFSLSWIKLSVACVNKIGSWAESETVFGSWLRRRKCCGISVPLHKQLLKEDWRTVLGKIPKEVMLGRKEARRSLNTQLPKIKQQSRVFSRRGDPGLGVMVKLCSIKTFSGEPLIYSWYLGMRPAKDQLHYLSNPGGSRLLGIT